LGENGLVTWPGHESKLPAAVENIVDLHEFFAIIFDEPDVAMQTTTVNLDRDLRHHMVFKMAVVEYHLAVQVHPYSPFFPF
jgi:hypothetical protein